MQNTLRLMLEEDIEALVPVAATAPDPWRETDLRAALGGGVRRCYVVETAGRAAGFACCRFWDEHEAELEQIAISPALRGKGLGEALLRFSLAELEKQGAARVLLEVRASNTAALRLYEKLGFAAIAVRPGMYAHPTEDGLTMESTLDGRP